MAGVLSSEESTATRGTNRRTRVGTGELDAITRHRIQVWCPDIPLSRIAGVCIAKVIREDKNDVRFVERCAHLATDSTLGAEQLTRMPGVLFLSGRCVIQTGRLMEHL